MIDPGPTRLATLMRALWLAACVLTTVAVVALVMG